MMKDLSDKLNQLEYERDKLGLKLVALDQYIHSTQKEKYISVQVDHFKSEGGIFTEMQGTEIADLLEKRRPEMLIELDRLTKEICNLKLKVSRTVLYFNSLFKKEDVGKQFLVRGYYYVEKDSQIISKSESTYEIFTLLCEKVGGVEEILGFDHPDNFHTLQWAKL